MNYRDIVRALYTKPAFRGSRRTGEHGKWWADTPEEASEYAAMPTDIMNTDRDYLPNEGARVIPGVIDDTGFLEIEGQGAEWNSIRGSQIPDPRVRAELAAYFNNMTDEEFNRATFNTDLIGEFAERLGYPGVTFRNIHDMSGKPHTQYYVPDKRRRRSRFAQFLDPNSEDLMGSLLLSLMGGGAGAAALTQDDRNA